ncbi:MAG: Rpn family recombination-promoting nuclease/putative transposase [Lachnospiraceae bacterium]|nr:Rpn family recombination-promoting nuclease/putative transposase [Lachnospiraceae bacterium]
MTQTDDNYIMLPTVDYCFKELMQNPKIRQGFVAALLKVDPKTIEGTTLLPTILSPDTEDGKLGILDVLVKLEDGTLIDMEMQVALFDAWQNRILFYLCKMYADQLKKGEDYDKLKKCIHVSILNFKHFPDDEECYRTISLRDNKTNALYSDLLEIQILELKKLPKELPEDDNVISWMRFFSGKKAEDFQTMANDTQNEYINEACQTLFELSADEKKRLEYEAREKAIRDYNAGMNYARKQGIAEGKAQGIAEGMSRGEYKKVWQLVHNWTPMGHTVSEMAELLNISEDCVRQIQSEDECPK